MRRRSRARPRTYPHSGAIGTRAAHGTRKHRLSRAKPSALRPPPRSFTGATGDTLGVVRAADGGTLFLDETGELPLEMQPKLLRFLENGEGGCLTREVATALWNALILNALLAGPLRLSEFGEGPGDKVLSARLKDLKERDLVLRHVAHGPPVRVTYELSDKGRAFGQVAEAIERWGEKLALGERASPRSSATRRDEDWG